MQTVFIDVGEELSRMVALANLMPMTNVEAIEQIMLQLREDPGNAEGAKVSLDLVQSVRELKSAAEAYSKFIIKLADEMKQRPPGGSSA